MREERQDTVLKLRPREPARVDPIVFATDDLPPSERLAAWNARFRSVNAISVAPPDSDSISCRNENWVVGAMLFSSSRTTPARFERSRQDARRDGLDHWVVRVLRHGENNLQAGAERYRIVPGQPVLFSLDQAWISDWSNAAWISLCIPRDAYPELSAGFAALGAGPRDAPAAALLADYLAVLERHLRDATPACLPALAEATRAMLTACMLCDAAPRSIAPSDIAVAQFERVRTQVRQHLGSPLLDAQRLARMAGMSRSALYRLFEPHGGVSRYIQSMRLRVVHASLSDPGLADLPIATLAERAGFFDPSTFSRAFRAQYGYAPRDVRAATMAGQVLPARLETPSQCLSSTDFGALLRQIAVDATRHVSGGAALGRAA